MKNSIVLALVGCLAIVATPVWAVPVGISAITTDNPNAVYTSSANLTSLTAGGVTFLPENFVVVSDAMGASGGLYEGVAEPLPIPSTLNEVYADLDVTTGQANSVNVDLFFAQPLVEFNGTDPNLALMDIATGTQGDGWTVTAIVGGTPGSPVLGGTPLAFSQSSFFTDTGRDVSVRRNASETLDQGLWGGALDFADLGLTAADQILGVRVVTGSGDPNLIVGFNAAPVPEPATATLLLMASAGLALARRRRR